MEKCEKRKEGDRLGLVLEGGAMRGLYTAGVLDVLLEQGIQADTVLGVSAGAIHGCSYVSGQGGRSIRYYEKYRGDRHFMGLYCLLTTGDMVGRKFCYEELPLRLDPFDEAAFEASPMDFYVTTTNLLTGKAEYVLCKELRPGAGMEYIRAGASMPLASRIVRIGGVPYLDGGVADSIPYAAAGRLGCGPRIVVLTRAAGYRKEPAKMGIFNAFYKKYPNFLRAMAGRYAMYNAEVSLVEHAAARGEAFLLRPSRDLQVSRMEKDVGKLRALYELGRADTLAQLPALRGYLHKNGR